MKIKSLLAYSAIFFLLFCPLLVFATTPGDVVDQAKYILEFALAPILTFVATNFVKGKIDSKSKAVNYIVFVLVCVVVFLAWASLGFTGFSFFQLLGSANAIWGLVAFVKEKVLGILD